VNSILKKAGYFLGNTMRFNGGVFFIKVSPANVLYRHKWKS